MLSLKRNGLWVVLVLYIGLAMIFHTREHLFISNGPYPEGKLLTWLMFFSFLAYSIFCSTKENLFKTIKTIYPFYWARQIGIDLYLGLIIFSTIIYLNEGSFLILAFWLVPLLLFANITTLLYVALNYDSLISKFV